MKYYNKKVIYGGIKFDSKKERDYCIYLKDQKNKGKIVDFKLQPEFVLIPSQKDKLTGRVIERPLKYRADFIVYYTDSRVDNLEIIDVKGFKTEVYKIKRKLMLFIHGIRIKEV